jgi:carbon storage regulator CsrA
MTGKWNKRSKLPRGGILMLTRRVGNIVKFVHPDGTELLVELVQVRGNYVRLAVQAPANVRIMRGEKVQSHAPDSAE